MQCYLCKTIICKQCLRYDKFCGEERDMLVCMHCMFNRFADLSDLYGTGGSGWYHRGYFEEVMWLAMEAHYNGFFGEEHGILQYGNVDVMRNPINIRLFKDEYFAYMNGEEDDDDDDDDDEND